MAYIPAYASKSLKVISSLGAVQSAVVWSTSAWRIYKIIHMTCTLTSRDLHVHCTCTSLEMTISGSVYNQVLNLKILFASLPMTVYASQNTPEKDPFTKLVLIMINEWQARFDFDCCMVIIHVIDLQIVSKHKMLQPTCKFPLTYMHLNEALLFA